jgi:hypothetical protein
VRFPADDVKPFTFVNLNMEFTSDLKGVIGVRICCPSAIFDNDFTRLKVAYN